MTQIIFATESYTSRSLPVSSQRLVNFFMEKQPPDAKSQVPLFGVPGLVWFSEVGVGPIRGMLTLDGTHYAVSGTKFYSIDSEGAGTLLGSGISGSEPISMADNGTQICIVNGVAGYIWSAAGGFQQITDDAFYPSDTVTFFDDYFVFNRKGTNQFFISELLDGLSYNGLDFASAEASSKHVVGITQNTQLLFIFSEDHIEIWYDAGSSDFPFQRYTGGVIWRGCVAPLSILKQDQVIFFLGDDLVFYRMQGTEVARVSTHAIEHVIAEDSDPSKAFCFNHNVEGHKFIYLTLPESRRTLGYDTTTQLWHERESWDANNGNLERWRANCSAESYNSRTYFGDAYTGTIWYSDWDTFTEGGNTIRGLIVSKPYSRDRKRVFCSRLELSWQTGVGLPVGYGSDPQVMLRKSVDGGQTWSLQQPWRSLGKIGEYLRRLRWMRLGSAYQWTFEATITDPVRRVFIEAHADFEEGM